MSEALHDPGGKVRIKLGPNVCGAAEFSKCGIFRYTLERWEGDRTAPYALWVGMNPSTASADKNDPTILREWRRTADQLHLSRMVKVNLSPYRATSPKDMAFAGYQSEYSHNRRTILMLAMKARVVIMAHGVPPAPLIPWQQKVSGDLRAAKVPLYCFGTTMDGFPRHPLYIAMSVLIRPWEPVDLDPRWEEN